MLRMNLLVILPLALGLLVAFEAPSLAGDWPQVLGPGRNGIAEGERLAPEWPKSGLKTLWQRPTGSGYAGIAVAGDTAVLFHRIRNSEIVEALDAATGEVRWKTEFPASYVPSFNDDNGPLCVPLIEGDRVYVYGARGDLHSVALKDGRKVWSRDTFGDYNSNRPFRGEPPEGYFGLGSSPIIVGDRLLLNVGGDAAGAGIVAFALDDGRTLWKSTSERASYSSPVAATIGKEQHVIFATRLSALSVDPADGRVRFAFPYGAPGPKVTGANPVILKDRLFLTASYGVGAVYAEIGPKDARTLWADDETLSSQYTTPVEDGGLLYGIHGRQDVGIAELRCIDPARQKVLWSEPNFGYATLIKADGKLLILKTDGELLLGNVSSKAWQPLARATVFTSTTRALPALSNGRLFVRDKNTLKCIELPGR